MFGDAPGRNVILLAVPTRGTVGPLLLAAVVLLFAWAIEARAFRGDSSRAASFPTDAWDFAPAGDVPMDEDLDDEEFPWPRSAVPARQVISRPFSPGHDGPSVPRVQAPDRSGVERLVPTAEAPVSGDPRSPALIRGPPR